ncbi:MAG: hypothetical protein O2944_08375 [Proteobacteria bacterium]|nr:hypothetical protein [Pseudomonadota bacterium]
MYWRSLTLAVAMAGSLIGTGAVLADTANAGKKTEKASLPSPGCAWLGSRAVHSLVRDDVVAARDFVNLYDKFGCPSKQLRAAFDCTVKSALPEQAEIIGKRIADCWSGAPAAQPPKPSTLPPPTAVKPPK